MYFKTATVACSLAALLMVGCDTDDTDVRDEDDIVVPAEDVSPDTQVPETEPSTPAPETTDQDLEPTTPPASPEETSPAPADDSPDADEPVVEEVETDSLPEVENE